MPNCFQLFAKGDNRPLSLNDVDAAICAMLGVPVDPKFYVCSWYHVIGFLLAMHHDSPLGSSKLRQRVTEWYADEWYRQNPTEAATALARMLTILDFMEERYTSNAFVEIGRRV